MAQEITEDEITDLSSPEVLRKYKESANIANNALAKVIQECKPGKRIFDLCSFGDKLMNDAISKLYNKKKIEKGIAFPTSISVNNIAGHFSPLVEDKTVLQSGDLAKIDLGVHLDGYAAVVAHTIVVSEGQETVEGKKADVLFAAHEALKSAVKALVPGTKNGEITQILQKVAESHNVNLLEGVLSHEMKRFVIDGEKVIMNRPTVDQKVEEFVVEPNEVYGLDVVMSTGEGKAKEMDQKPTIFKRAVNQQYRLKLKASRYVFNEISQRFPTFPFALRAFEEAKGKLGITEMVSHGLLDPYPVLFEKPGELVAQFKTTVLVTPKSGPTAITSNPRLPNTGTTQQQSSTAEPATAAAATGAEGTTAKKKKRRNNKNKKKQQQEASAKTVTTAVPEGEKE